MSEDAIQMVLRRRPRTARPLPAPAGFKSWRQWVAAGCPDLGPPGPDELAELAELPEPSVPGQRPRSCGNPRPLLRLGQDSLWPAELPKPSRKRRTPNRA